MLAIKKRLVMGGAGRIGLHPWERGETESRGRVVNINVHFFKW